jgi:hypothetical protein
MTTHHTTVRPLALAGAWMLVYFSACTGTIGDPASPNPNGPGRIAGGGSGSSDGGSDSGSAGGSGGNGDAGNPGMTAVNGFACPSATTPSSGPTQMLLLSRAQYVNTLQSLFGAVVPNLDSALGPDGRYQTTDGAVTQFGLVQPNIDLATVTNFQTAAELVAAAVVASPATLSTLVPCAAGANRRACAQTFVQNFGALAYRAPLTDPADIARHMALYDAGATNSDAHGIEMVLRGMLQSPRFLYRVEIGSGPPGPNALKLSGYEVAARLSYLLWNTLPDAQLTQAAAAGSLDTKAKVSAQLMRMLQDPKGQGLVRGFLEELIQLPGLPSAVKDPIVYPDWTAVPTLPVSMQGQARAFFDDVLARQGGTLSALLTSPTVFVNTDLAAYYGVNGGNSFQAVTLPAGKASGLLTLPAFLTLMAKPNKPWPIYRGRHLRPTFPSRPMFRRACRRGSA